MGGGGTDDEKVIIHRTCSTHMVVVLQPNAGVGFAIVLDDVAQHSEALQEMPIPHGASKHFWPWSFGAEATSLTIIMPPVLQVLHSALGLRVFTLLVVLIARLGF
jgi:hypothetical protein